jgi:hypothetical protein
MDSSSIIVHLDPNPDLQRLNERVTALEVIVKELTTPFYKKYSYARIAFVITIIVITTIVGVGISLSANVK